MHVEGFGFDLAPTLAREADAVERSSHFFDVIHQDPVISRVKLIAEPWDLGLGGYQVGNFPVGWAEWNGRYRDAIRRYWRGDPGQVADLAYRLTGSSDLYQDDGRRPYASGNFVTPPDGFTPAAPPPRGTPMLCGGDEIGRTQGGNNNAYCQDHEVSWHDWRLDDRARGLLAFTRPLIHLR